MALEPKMRLKGFIFGVWAVDYDVAIIGSGPGGYICALRASQLGLKVACIEELTILGGTCLRVGCIPSKTLLHSSETYANFLDVAAKYSVAESHIFDFTEMMTRKNKVVAALGESIQMLFRKHKVTQVQGRGHLIDANRIQVGDQTLSAKNIVLAAGSEAIALPFLPFDEHTIISSTGALSFQEIPKKMIIIGGGVIGVELASVYSRLGADITIIEVMPSICPGIDKSLSEPLAALLKRQKMNIMLNTSVVGAKKIADNHVEIFIRREDGVEEKLETEKVLVAVGRKPRSNDLGLASLPIDMTIKGAIIVDSSFRTGQPNIYAIGDLIEGPMLAHRASIEGTTVAEIIAGKNPPPVEYMTIPNVVYTHPEIATVGLSEEEAKAIGRPLKKGIATFRANSRAYCCDNYDGLVKVIADAQTERLLGLHILADHASEMIAVGALALAKRATLSDVARLAFAHPTYSESIQEACLRALGH